MKPKKVVKPKKMQSFQNKRFYEDSRIGYPCHIKDIIQQIPLVKQQGERK